MQAAFLRAWTWTFVIGGIVLVNVDVSGDIVASAKIAGLMRWGLGAAVVDQDSRLSYVDRSRTLLGFRFDAPAFPGVRPRDSLSTQRSRTLTDGLTNMAFPSPGSSRSILVWFRAGSGHSALSVCDRLHTQSPALRAATVSHRVLTSRLR